MGKRRDRGWSGAGLEYPDNPSKSTHGYGNLPNYTQLPDRTIKAGWVPLPEPLAEPDNNGRSLRPDWFPEGPSATPLWDEWSRLCSLIFSERMAQYFAWRESPLIQSEVCRYFAAAYNVEGSCMRGDRLTEFQMTVALKLVLASVPLVFVAGPQALDMSSIRPAPAANMTDKQRDVARYIVTALLSDGYWILVIYDRATFELWLFDPSEQQTTPARGKRLRDFVVRWLEGSQLVDKGGFQPFLVGLRGSVVPANESGAICMIRAIQFFYDHYNWNVSQWYPDWSGARFIRSLHARAANSGDNLSPRECGLRFVAEFCRHFLGTPVEAPLRPIRAAPLLSWAQLVGNNFNPNKGVPQEAVQWWWQTKRPAPPPRTLWDGPTLQAEKERRRAARVPQALLDETFSGFSSEGSKSQGRSSSEHRLPFGPRTGEVYEQYGADAASGWGPGPGSESQSDFWASSSTSTSSGSSLQARRGSPTLSSAINVPSGALRPARVAQTIRREERPQPSTPPRHVSMSSTRDPSTVAVLPTQRIDSLTALGRQMTGTSLNPSAREGHERTREQPLLSWRRPATINLLPGSSRNPIALDRESDSNATSPRSSRNGTSAPEGTLENPYRIL